MLLIRFSDRSARNCPIAAESARVPPPEKQTPTSACTPACCSGHVYDCPCEYHTAVVNMKLPL
jgi:hypothetical protein